MTTNGSFDLQAPGGGERGRLPLAHITVVDLSRALAGPYCSSLLGDLGADVIKVEPANGGDFTRSWPPFQDEHSLYFESANRNKHSIALDFYSAEGREVLRDLVRKADVVLENFRPGTMARIGLDPERLRAEQPDLIVASITGFGSTGPLRDAAGLDQVAQGMSGLMSVTGPAGSEGFRVGVPVTDMVSGIFAALGVAAALAARSEHGQGALVGTSLLESALALGAFQAQNHLSTGSVPRPQGNDHSSLTPYGVFATGDIPLILAVGNETQWLRFCELLGRPDLAADERFASGRVRTEHREALRAEIESVLCTRPAAEWIEMIRPAGIPCGPIYDYGQVFEDPQVKALEMVQPLQRAGDGTDLPMVRGPISIDGKPPAIYRNPPTLGQHSRLVLEWLGYDAERIEQLCPDGRTVGKEPAHAVS